MGDGFTQWSTMERIDCNLRRNAVLGLYMAVRLEGRVTGKIGARLMAHPRGCKGVVSKSQHSQGQPSGVQHQGQRLQIDCERTVYQAGVLVIRFFGTHAEYEKIDAESV